MKMLKDLFWACTLILSMTANAQLPKWILGSSQQAANGSFYSYGPGNLKFYEVNFKGTLSSTPRIIGASIQNIKSVGTQDVMQTAVDTTSNTVLFYAFAAATGPWNNGFPPISPDTIYFTAYNPSTSADEVFGKVPSTGWGASVIESELVQKPGSSSEYYFIYKTQATSNNLDYIRYVTIDIINKTVSAPINLVTTEKSGEGMAVSQLNCFNQRWLFVTRPESNGNITLRRCTISNTGITPAVDTYTISIPGNSTSVVVGVEIAPTNNYLAVANYNNTTVNKNMTLFDYNNSTGTVSNERYYKNGLNYPFVTMEFSPNGSRVYILQGGSGSVPNVIYNCPVSSTNYTVTSANQISSMTLNQSLTLEAAYDGNIYVDPGQSSTSMYVINNPNSATPTITIAGANFFGNNDRIGSGFPDQVDGDKYPNGPINLSVAASGTILCAGQTATLTASSNGASFQWSGGSTATSSVIAVSPISTSTYVITATNGTCSKSDSIVIQVNPVPTVTVAGVLNICIGQTTTLTASGGITYQWSGGSTATTSMIAVTPTATTSYSVETTTGGCTSSMAVVTVSVTPNPTVTIISSDTTICFAQTVTLTASGGTTYQWSGGSNATASMIIQTPTVTTNYSVEATTNGCTSSTAAVTVSVTPNPTVSITPSDTTVCPAQTITLTASGGTSYQWSGGSSATTSTIVVNSSATTVYSVTASDGTCSATSGVTIHVSASPTITVIPSNATICSGQNATLTASGGTSYQWSGGSSSTSSVITVSPALTSTYIVSVSNGTCSALDSVTLQVNPTPTVNIIGGPNICPGQTATLTASGGTTYQWSGGSTSTSSVISVSPAVTTFYTVTATTNSCTSAPVSDTITVLPQPSVTAVASNTALCLGQAATITASGGVTYQWSGGSSSTNDTIIVSPTNTNTYVVTASNGTCTAVDSVIVQAFPIPTVTVNGNQSICSGQPTTLTASGGSAYQWSGGSTSTSSMITVSPTINTDYTVTPSNGTCVGNPAVITVSVTVTPTISVTGTQSICAGQTATLSASGGGSSYQWSNGITDTSSTIQVNPSGSVTYSVTSSNLNCMSAPATISVSVTPNPTLSIAATSTAICVGQTSTLTASGASSYQWSGGSSSTTPVIIVGPGTTTNYTVSGSNGTCVGNPIAVTVSVTPTPTIIISPSQTICAGQTATLTVSGASSYQWSGGSTATTSMIVVNPASTMNYSVTGSNGNCPGAPVSATVIVLPIPTLSVSGNQNICSGQSTTLTATGASSYQWSGGISSTSSSVVVNPITTTTYTLDGAAFSCQANPIVLSVNVTLTPTVITGGGQNMCSGQTASLTATGGNSYQWSGSLSTASVIAVSPGTTTTYTVVALNGNCSSMPAIITVSVTPTPTISLLSTDSLLCSGQTATLTASGGSSYQWSGGSTSAAAVIAVSPTVTTSYTVSSVNGNCANNANIVIPVLPFVLAQFTYSLNNCIPPTVVFEDQSAMSPYWNFGDGTTSTASTPTHSYNPGIYLTSMITNAGTPCADTASQNISVVYTDHRVIPNIFTPNGDGINDDLTFSGLDPCSEYSLIVYNRWGQKLFETDSPQVNSWNGTINGKNASDDTYFYVLTKKNDNKSAIKGHVTLIR